MGRDGQPDGPHTAAAAPGATQVDFATAAGTAILSLDLAARPSGVVVLGHGAGGDIDAPDLLAVRLAALTAGLAVVRVRQPYRVAGRRAPAPAAQLDAAFSAVLGGVRNGEVHGLPAHLPLVVGGRSSGARVAARTSEAAAGVLALAFPLVPPGKSVSRVDELLAVRAPVLVLQGSRDPFGSAQQVAAAVQGSDIIVVEVAGADHSFRARKVDAATTKEALSAVQVSAQRWLEALLPMASGRLSPTAGELPQPVGNRPDGRGRSTRRR